MMSDQTASREELPVLFVTEGPGRGQQKVIRSDELLIGRGQHCDLYIADRRISREHSRITRDEDGNYYVEDLESRNGTFVNGERVEGPRQLHEGDEIQIALCVRIQFVGNEATVPIDAEKMATAQKSLTLESRTRQVEINDEMVDPPLSLYQYRLLELLYEKRGGICTREEVVKAVWPDDFEAGVSEQAIDALVRRLRDRLADLEPDHQYIMTVRGHGFRLVQPGEDG